METHLKIATYIAELLDEKFQAGKFKFGIDPILGFLPGIGDIIPIMLSVYLIWIARQLALPEHKINHMMRNIVIDVVLGIIPVVGDLSDFVFKANTKNLSVIKEHIRQHSQKGQALEGQILN